MLVNDLVGVICVGCVCEVEVFVIGLLPERNVSSFSLFISILKQWFESV